MADNAQKYKNEISGMDKSAFMKGLRANLMESTNFLSFGQEGEFSKSLESLKNAGKSSQLQKMVNDMVSEINKKHGSSIMKNNPLPREQISLFDIIMAAKGEIAENEKTLKLAAEYKKVASENPPIAGPSGVRFEEPIETEGNIEDGTQTIRTTKTYVSDAASSILKMTPSFLEAGKYEKALTELDKALTKEYIRGEVDAAQYRELEQQLALKRVETMKPAQERNYVMRDVIPRQIRTFPLRFVK